MHADYWQRCFESLRVGMTMREVISMCESNAAEILPAGSKYQNPKGQLTMHGRGLGSDGPLSTVNPDEATLIQVLAAGWVFIFKPSISFEAGGRNYNGSWGDTMVLTDQGPKRLGNRPVGLVTTGLDT